MLRPSVTFILWIAIASFIVVNGVVGDTWIGINLTVRAVEWYKALVPLPYVAMLALIHARRTTGPRWLEAALLAALLWPVSTILVDFAYLALTVGMTFQISDTDIEAKRVRRVALHHALLSYVFGTVIVAITVSSVAGLLGR